MLRPSLITVWSIQIECSLSDKQRDDDSWVTNPSLVCVVETTAGLIIDYSTYSIKRAFFIDSLFKKRNPLEVCNTAEA